MGGTSGVADSLTKWVGDVLDRTGDGLVDTQSETSPEQLAKLLGQEGKVSSASVGQIIESIRRQAGPEASKQAAFLANTLKDKDGFLVASGNSALHFAKKLGLRVEECRISADRFQMAVEDYLKGKPLAQPQFISARPTASAVNDPYTNSNYRDVQVKHVAIDLKFDFKQKQIEGRVEYQLGRVAGGEFRLDTEALTIKEVFVRTDKGAKLGKASFSMGDERPFLGRPLIIQLPQATKGALSVVVVYETRTDERADALNWLEAAQTADRKSPFFYTQGQYTHNRGWVPLQDTPAAKTTYDLKVRVPSDLNFRVVASNNLPHQGRPQTPIRQGGLDVWKFQVTKPISSYLLAVAAGDFVPVQVSKRSIVHVEPSLVAKAKQDYADYEIYLKAAEKILGPEPFGLLDTLILPPSFPFGGMENLGVNMNNNMIITGDRSLIWVAIHEFSHAWFGNLVTNARLEDFWLNEGMTMYFQRLVFESVFGTESFNINAIQGRSIGESEWMGVGNSSNTCLATQLQVANPDDAVTYTPYEKGFLLAKWMEEKIGKKKMVGFLRDYLKRYQHQVLTTEDFVQFMQAKTGIKAEELDPWLYGPGVPAEAPSFYSQLADRQVQLADQWIQGIQAPDSSLKDVEKWGYNEWTLFLDRLSGKETIPEKAMDALNVQMDRQVNAEVLYRWYILAAKHHYSPAYGGMETFLGTYGRIKVIRPIYAALVATGQKETAKAMYDRVKLGLSRIARGSLDNLFK